MVKRLRSLVDAAGRHPAGLAATAIFLVVLNVAWFRVIRFEVFMGDDVYLYHYFSRGGFIETCLLRALDGKYRPVYYVAQYLLIQVFGPHYPLYLWANVAFSAVIAFAVFLEARWLAKGNYLVGLGAAVLFETARFSYYNIAQVLGLMEALGILWTLGLIYFAVRFVREETLDSALGMAGTYFLAAFTNERFLAAAPFLLGAILWSRKRRLAARVGMATLVVAPFPLNVLAKKVFLGAPFFVGTGGTAIAFNLKQMGIFWLHGLLNVFGINLGPDFLSMIDYRRLPHFNQALGLVFALAGAFLISQLVAKKRGAGLRTVLWFGLLIAGLLVSASVTIRQEFRWLYAPYLVALLFWAYASTRASSRAAVAFAALVASGILNDIYFRGQRSGLYFLQGQAIAQSFYEQSIKRYGSAEREFYLKPFLTSGWVLPAPYFFEQFLGDHPAPVRTFDEEAAQTWDAERFELAKVFALRGHSTSLIEVTDVYRRRAFMRSRQVLVDLVDKLGAAKAEGQVRSNDLPGGTRISEVNIEGVRGIQELPDASVGFDLGPIDDRASLAVSVALNPASVGWNVSDGVRASIAVVPSHGAEKEIWAGEVLPADPERFLSLPLSACGGPECRVVLRTNNLPGHDARGDSLVWLAPKVVTSPR